MMEDATVLHKSRMHFRVQGQQRLSLVFIPFMQMFLLILIFSFLCCLAFTYVHGCDCNFVYCLIVSL